MAADDHPNAPGLDEGSWIYLSAGRAEDPDTNFLREELTEACARSGWAVVTHPSPRDARMAGDPGRFFAGVSHAVEHADVVVSVIGPRSELADAELTLAYSHRRPVVGVRIEESELDSEARMLLSDYDRATIVACDTPEQCAVSLQRALSDPQFAETIRQAG